MCDVWHLGIPKLGMVAHCIDTEGSTRTARQGYEVVNVDDKLVKLQECWKSILCCTCTARRPVQEVQYMRDRELGEGVHASLLSSLDQLHQS